MNNLISSSVAVALAVCGLAAEQAASRAPASIPNMAGKVITVMGAMDPSVLRQNQRGAVTGDYRDVSGVDRPDDHDDWEA